MCSECAQNHMSRVFRRNNKFLLTYSIVTPFLAGLPEGEKFQGYFKQGGPHMGSISMAVLEEVFGERLRPPDMNPCHYHFWRKLKEFM